MYVVYGRPQLSCCTRLISNAAFSAASVSHIIICEAKPDLNGPNVDATTVPSMSRCGLEVDQPAIAAKVLLLVLTRIDFQVNMLCHVAGVK